MEFISESRKVIMNPGTLLTRLLEEKDENTSNKNERKWVKLRALRSNLKVLEEAVLICD